RDVICQKVFHRVRTCDKLRDDPDSREVDRAAKLCPPHHLVEDRAVSITVSWQVGVRRKIALLYRLEKKLDPVLPRSDMNVDDPAPPSKTSGNAGVGADPNDLLTCRL